jgi:tetratricopeptide (TPR) repeat protein
MGATRTYSLLLLAAGLVTGLSWMGCRKSEPLLHPPIYEPQIKVFFDAKEAQARQLVSQENKELPPEIWPYFEAGKKGDWATVTNLYGKMASRSHQFDGNKSYDKRMLTMAWNPINETDRFYLQCTQPDSKLALAFGEEVMRIVPPGSIYFGDSDTGRFVPTALCRDHAKGDPFFVLTQHALADGLYLAYLRTMFESKLYIPTTQDSQQAFDKYIQDAIVRMKKGALQPGEDVKEEGNRISVSGQISVMAINSLISKVIFEKNPHHEFYVCEGFPNAWIYPHAEPHGPIIKINRQKPVTLTPDIITRDRDYWNKRITLFIGDWLKEETTIAEICEFAEKIYVREDFSGFTGDTNFTRMATFWRRVPAYQPAAAIWSKCRSAIAGIYVWRINDCAEQMKSIYALPPEELRKKQTEINRLLAEQQRYIKAADYAYRQAFALNPSSPEAVFRYASLLTSLNRFEEALQMVQVAKKLNPEAMTPLAENLRKRVKSDQNGAGSP